MVVGILGSLGSFRLFQRDEDYKPLEKKGHGSKYRRGADRPETATAADVSSLKSQAGYCASESSRPAAAGFAAGRHMEPRVFHAQTTLPQELTFHIPQDHICGKPVCVAGPHGALMMPVSDSAKPGDHCSVRLGPANSYKVLVPEDKAPGDMVTFQGDKGESLQAPVPDGFKGGDTFEVFQPALMVQVPLKARAGDQLVFFAPDGRELSAPVPREIAPGQYFAVDLSSPAPPSEVKEPKEKDEEDVRKDAGREELFVE